MKIRKYRELDALLAAARQPQPEHRSRPDWRRQVMADIRRQVAGSSELAASEVAVPLALMWRMVAAAVVIAMVCAATYAVYPRQTRTTLFSGVAFDSFEKTITMVARL